MSGGLIRNIVTLWLLSEWLSPGTHGTGLELAPTTVPWYGSGWCYDGHQSHHWTWSPASVCDGVQWEGHPGYHWVVSGVPLSSPTASITRHCVTHHISSHWPSFVTLVEHSHDTYNVVTELWLATGITLQDIMLFPPPEDASCHQNYWNNTLANKITSCYDHIRGMVVYSNGLWISGLHKRLE